MLPAVEFQMFKMSRREMLAASVAGTAAVVSPMNAEPNANHEFTFCLNTSTIRGQDLGIVREVEIAAKVGYGAIEPWINELDKFIESGGRLKDLGKLIADSGLKVESAIGFASWVVDDPSARAKGLEEAKRCMDIVYQIGGKRLAAPPVGATDRDDIPILRIAERYRQLLELGDKMGVTPQAELWGFSKTMGRLNETAAIVAETGHPNACILPDIYHIHKGGSDFADLAQLGRSAMHNFHLNDYPALPPRAEITDAHRVYPGDGVAPIKDVIRLLAKMGFKGILSLELFNREYWKQDATQVARTGLEKMKAVVKSAVG